ncbi:MAG: hypothetical protein AB7U20_01930 [Planctomycetaceae bacterium]
MDRVKLESVEPSELTQVEGGFAVIAIGLGIGFGIGMIAGGYAHDELNGQNSMSGLERAAILGALKQGGIIK